MFIRLSKKQKNNKKRSKKNNLLKNQYGGMWEELFTRELGTHADVSAELGIRSQNDIFIIDPETYRLICERLRESRDILNDMDHPELFPLCYTSIMNYINNVSLLFRSFVDSNVEPGPFYFHFNDGQLYPDPVQYNDYDDLDVVDQMILSFNTPAEQDQFRDKVKVNRVPNFAESRPQYNNIVISCIFITVRLLDNIFSTLQRSRESLLNHLSPQEIIRLYKLINTTVYQYLYIREIISNFLGFFTDNLVKILTSSKPIDIAYTAVLNNDVIHLYTLLGNDLLPYCPEVYRLLNPILLHLYLRQNIPHRFSFLKCISKKPIFRLLAEHNTYTYALRCQDLIRLSDITQIPEETSEEKEILLFNLIKNTIMKMYFSNALQWTTNRLFYQLTSREFTKGMTHLNSQGGLGLGISIVSNINSLIISICNTINVLLSHLHDLDDSENQAENIDDINHSLINYLFFIRVIIYNNLTILDTFLVCFLTNMINATLNETLICDDLRKLVYYIIQLCYDNKTFKNYLANELDQGQLSNYAEIEEAIADGLTILTQLTKDYNNLKEINDHISENLRCPVTFNLPIKLGVISGDNIDLHSPITDSEIDRLNPIDLFAVMKNVYTYKKNPLNNKSMTLDQLERFQLRHQSQIQLFNDLITALIKRLDLP